MWCSSVVIASGAVNGVLALLSIFKMMVIYDTLFYRTKVYHQSLKK